MFDNLQAKIEATFKKLRNRGVLNKSDVELAMKEVRMALLEADVNFKVAKEFCEQATLQAVGEAVLKSLSPDQQVIKIVHQELIKMMGQASAPLQINVAPPAIIMLVGLQGSGKTTTAAKLANYIRSELKKKPLLVPADVYRPAAIEQLTILAEKIKVTCYPTKTTDDPLQIAKASLDYALGHGCDTIIIDTAGRLQVDQELMNELQEISSAITPHEILLVADAMTGQEALNVASGFDKALEIDGIILTKLDGDARGGAALSMRAVTGKPIKFMGVGEKIDGLEIFHPERMASRILGMGDVLTLIEKASKEINVEDSIDLQKKLKRNEFTLEDFLGQLRTIKKMGSITSLASMIPGMGKLVKNVDPEKAEKELRTVESIILSMTYKERRKPEIINGSRRKRIARGSGTSVEEINRLLKQFLEMRRMMSQFAKVGMGGLGKGLMGMLGR